TDYLEQFFRDLGVPHQRQPVAPLRDNLVARCDVPGARSTLLFEAHQDTVPVDNMTVEPFGAALDGGRLYGRGACDVKGGLAAMLAAFARVARERPAGACNLILAASVDEEHTFLGVQHLVKALGPGRPDAAVVAEPTRLSVVHAHKGVVRWHLETAGRSCHSSRPELGENAIYHMARVLPAVEEYAAWLRASRLDALLGPPTLSVGRSAGGTGANAARDRCRVVVARRLVPGEDPRAAPGQLLEWLKRKVPAGVPFSCSTPILSSPALGAAGSEDLARRLGEAID